MTLSYSRHLQEMIIVIVLINFFLSVVLCVDAEGGQLLSSKVVALVQLNSNHTEITRETEVVPYGCHRQTFHIALPDVVDMNSVKVFNSRSWESVPFQQVEQNSSVRGSLISVPFRCACLETSHEAQIHREMAQWCPASLHIKIVTDNVTLSPIAYDLHLLPASDGTGYDMRVSSHVNVTQRSGEDWNSISLRALPQQALSDVSDCDSRAVDNAKPLAATSNATTTITTVTTTTATDPVTYITTTTVTTTSQTIPSVPAAEPSPATAVQCFKSEPPKHLQVTATVPTNTSTNVLVQNVLKPLLYSYAPLGSRVAFLKAQQSAEDDAALTSILPRVIEAGVFINLTHTGHTLLHTVQNSTLLPTSSPPTAQMELGPDPTVSIDIEHYQDYIGACTITEYSSNCPYSRVLRYEVHNKHSVPHIVLLGAYQHIDIFEQTDHSSHSIDGGTSEQDFVSAVAAHVSELRSEQLTHYVNIHNNKRVCALYLQPDEVFEVKIRYFHTEYVHHGMVIATPTWEGSDVEQMNIYPDDCCCKYCK